MMGGYLISQLGGYTNPKAIEACFKISILAAASGALLPLINNYFLFVLLMWLLLFFGGSIVPGLTGIMLSSTPDNTKEISNSITHLCYNLLGYLPSPFLYGLVCKYTGGATSRYGLAFILLWSYFGVFFLYIAKNYREIAPEKGKREKNIPDSNHYDYDGNLNEDSTNVMAALYGRLSIT
jgi:MFS family permease